MANVQVAVRVRPLSYREKEDGGRIVVNVCENLVSTTNLKVPEQPAADSRERIRRFLFDYAFHSEDESALHASQEMVYEELGTKVLEASLEGYNACVLAYGQSGSGKTHTMMGTQEDPGLTPRVCQALFSRMDQVTASRNVKFKTDVSYLEIYNERVRDLLRPSGSEHRRYFLRVREHPKLGPYVQDLSHQEVRDASSLSDLLEKGNEKRAVASTATNGRSSRSHALFEVKITQARLDHDDLPSQVACRLHLVDLAGSCISVEHVFC